MSAKELEKSKQKAKRYERVMLTRFKNISCNWEERAGFNACYPCWCCINILFCSILVLFQGQVYSVSFIIKLSIYSLDAIHWFCATRKRKLSLCAQHCHRDLIFLSLQYSISPPRPGYLPGPTHFTCIFYACMLFTNVLMAWCSNLFRSNRKFVRFQFVPINQLYKLLWTIGEGERKCPCNPLKEDTKM